MKVNSDLIYQHIDWMKLKIKIHHAEINLFPKRKEIWWIRFGQNIGVEVNGKHDQFERPAIIIKVFNLDSFLVVPITSKIKRGEYLIGFLSNSNEKKMANLAQIRTVSINRFIRKVEVLNDTNFNQIIDKIKNFLSEKAETPSYGVSSESYIEGHNFAEISRGISSELPN